MGVDHWLYEPISLFVVSQLIAKPEPPDSECLKEEIVILPKLEKVEEKATEVTVKKLDWSWQTFIRGLIGREDALLEGSVVTILGCWVM